MDTTGKEAKRMEKKRRISCKMQKHGRSVEDMDYEEEFIEASQGYDFINNAELHHVNDGNASQVFGCDFINSADSRHMMTTLKTKSCW